jgi:hypothetical protein
MMPRKNIVERRAKKLSQIQKLKEELAKLEDQAADRIGRLAVKAGLGDLELDDAELAKEFEAIASKFRDGDAKSPAKNEGAALQG